MDSPTDDWAGYNRYVEMMRRILANHTDTPPSSDPRVSGWQQLPPEVLADIAQQSFHQVTDSRSVRSWQPLDNQPDLTIMDLDGLTRAIFQDRIIPDSVMIAVRIHYCAACDNRPVRGLWNHAIPFPDPFASCNIPPWTYLHWRASIVFIHVRCVHQRCGTCLPNKTFATMYCPGNKLNVLALAQLIMTPRWVNRQVRKTIDIGCTPRSPLGARRSVEFLDLLARLLYNIEIGFEHVAQDWPFELPQPLPRVVQEMHRSCRSWRETASAHQAGFQESQRLLDTNVVPTYLMVPVAAQAISNITRAMGTPRVDQTLRMVTAADIHDFMAAEIYGDCYMFLVFHGLSDLVARSMHNPDRGLALGSLLPSRTTFDWAVHKMKYLSARFDTIYQSQRAGSFRQWTRGDLPYLIHHCAMIQTRIRFGTATLSQWAFNISAGAWDDALEPPLPHNGRSATEARLTAVRCQLGILEHCDNLVGTFPRLDYTDQVRYQEYEKYHISEFISLYRTLVDHLETLFNDPIHVSANADPALFAALYFPTDLRIPVIAESDERHVLDTFLALNHAQLFYHQA